MKAIPVFSLLLLLYACTDADGDKPVRTQVNRNDSVIGRREAANPYVSRDISPMDVSYFPVDYPVLKMSGSITTPPVARVIYSRPQKQGRHIFGALLKWGEPWRLGANEATEIEFFREVTINNKKVKQGRYILYCIPQQHTWTLILNNNIFSWGLRQESHADAYRFQVPVRSIPQVIEFFTIVFQKAPHGADLVIAWDNAEARLPINY